MWTLDFPYSFGKPDITAVFRSCAEDFVVDEQLGFAPLGTGEHFYLELRKTGTNTQWLAEQIARYCGVKVLDVGFCGMKDRHAVTSQWFSIYAPRVTEFDWEPLLADLEGKVALLQASRHTKKLKRGQHQGNRFRIVLRQLKGNQEVLQERLQQVKKLGVPNYFGEQRFGNNDNNLHAAQSFLVDKLRLPSKQKKFALSAARAYLFNLVLAARVADKTWHELLPGDVAINGLPSGPLWGRGRLATQDVAKAREEHAIQPCAAWLEGLEHCGLQQERRALVLLPLELEWQLTDDTLTVSFELPAGEFATTLLREVAQLTNNVYGEQPV